MDLSTLGAIVSKGLFLTEREGHPAPRIVETPSGMLNAIGLQGIGAQRPTARTGSRGKYPKPPPNAAEE